MSWLFWRRRDGDMSYRYDGAIGGQDQVDEQHPLPTTFHFHVEGVDDYQEADATTGFPVNVVGTVGPSLFVSDQVAPNYGATSGALDANDAYGSAQAVNVPQKGRITKISVVDRDDVIAAGTLSIAVFSGPVPSAPASDAAIASAYTAGDIAKTITVQTFGSMIDLGAARFLDVVDIDEDYQLTGSQMWFQLSTTGTPTPTVNGMPLVQFFIQPLK